MASPDGVREDDFVIPAVPSNDDFESDPEVRFDDAVDEGEANGERGGLRVRRRLNVVVVAEKDDVAPLNRLAPAARSLFLESPFSARECFRETRISAFELKFK